jgi:DNA-binding MarR family transcriptional regulator
MKRLPVERRPYVSGSSGPTAAVDAVERLTFAALGLTSRSLAETPTADRLTLTQWRLLALLHDTRHATRLTALASAAGMSLPSASRLVSRLAARGLIDAEPDKSDTRALRIGLSSPGSAVVAAVVAERRRLLLDALRVAPLSADAVGELAATAEQIVRVSASELA